MAKKKETKKKEVKEFFEIEKKGKEKIIEKKGMEEEELSTKNQIKKENKQLRNFFIGIGIFILLIVIASFIAYNTTHFKYEGVKFNVVKEGNLILYKTSLPVMYEGNHIPYNFYLRKNPKDLEKIEFNGNLNIKQNAVLNITEDFDCEGDGVIAIANLLNLYEIIDVKVIADPEAGCDDNGRYMYIKIFSGEETKIEQFGHSCYNIYIKDCEILEGTERFMLETFVETNKIL